MGIHLNSFIGNAKHIFKLQSLVSSRNQLEVPKGHVAVVHVGESQMKRFVVPVTYMNHPSFAVLLKKAEEEFGYNHPMGALTIPCREEAFLNLASRLNNSFL